MRVDGYQVSFGIKEHRLLSDMQSVSTKQHNVGLQKGKSKKTQSVNLQNKSLQSLDEQLSQKLQVALLEKLHSVANRDRFYHRIYAEYEDMEFETKAHIKADGKELSIDLQANLKRSFLKHQKINLRNLKDPLVISLDGTMPELSSKKFYFDIDSDGSRDQISKLKENCGFLALDLNDNGKIDDGSELFGAKTGRGFLELKKYDSDNNGWIDENDPIFDGLRIWQKTPSKDTLVALGEIGIGAIFLGSAKGEFSFADLKSNELQGKIKSSGFFVFENGSAGVVSQIDMVVFGKEKQKNKELKKITDNFKATSVYSKDLSIKKEDDENIIDKLKKQIRALEKKLLNASPQEAKMIQARIVSLQSHIMSLIKMTAKV